jgi:hypothetical protein
MSGKKSEKFQSPVRSSPNYVTVLIGEPLRLPDDSCPSMRKNAVVVTRFAVSPGFLLTTW